MEFAGSSALAKMNDNRGVLGSVEALAWELHRYLVSVQQQLVLGPEPGDGSELEVETVSTVLGAYRELTSLDARLDAADRDVALAHHRILVQPVFLSVPLIRRSVDRPLGYPGDYRMVEMIFGNGPTPASRLGGLLETAILRAAPSEAHRFRAPWTHHVLAGLERDLGRTPRILSFACGPEVILREHLKKGGSADIVLCDHEPRALEHAKAEIVPILESRSSVTCMQMSAVNLLRARGRAALLQASGSTGFDAVLVLGLFDYLRDGLVHRLVRAFRDLLQPGGLLLTSNLDDDNPHRSLMEYVGDWYVLHRNRLDFQRLMLSETGFSLVELGTDPNGANLLFVGRAGSKANYPV